jgi:L-aspartate oxidase
MDTLRDGRPIVVGAGIAGLMTALSLAEHDERVLLLAAAPLGSDAATGWAQGGVAAALGADDAAALHAADTLTAADGLGDPAVAAQITREAPAAIERLEHLGARFDRGPDGMLSLGLEAAHGRRRVVHAAGDGTGREILRALVTTVRRTERITVLEGAEARRLLRDDDGEVAGVLTAGPGAEVLALSSARIIIATGGLGGLYARTTNPPAAVGRGLAMAVRAGALLADMEFVQFHPTALDAGLDPMPLISEAVRGEGAVLIDDAGRRFMADLGRAELEPRDIVARAAWRRLAEGGRVFLDVRAALGPRFAARFPAIAAACQAAGIDPRHQPIPVRPAAHYHMGGILVDEQGRSTVPGLWACGEAAATGLHGANRLASNSLLEAAVCATAVAQSVAGMAAPHRRPRTVRLPPAADAAVVRHILEAHVGVLRHSEGLEAALAALRPLAGGDGPSADPALVGLMIAAAALRREESRGAHYRTDFPDRSPAWARRIVLGIGDALAPADRAAA